MSIYKEIAALNEAYAIIKKFNTIGEVSCETQSLGNQYLKSLKADVIENNNKIWTYFSKKYNKNVKITKQFKLSMADFKMDELLSFHEENDIVFNRRCLDLNRNEVIVYCSEDKYEELLSKLKEISNTGFPYIGYDYKDAKNKIFNRNEKGYRKSLLNCLMPSAESSEKELLIKWFEKTDKIS